MECFPFSKTIALRAVADTGRVFTVGLQPRAGRAKYDKAVKECLCDPKGRTPASSAGCFLGGQHRRNPCSPNDAAPRRSARFDGMTWPVTSQSNGIRITGEALLGGRGRPLALQLFDIGGHVYRLDTPKVTNPLPGRCAPEAQAPPCFGDGQIRDGESLSGLHIPLLSPIEPPLDTVTLASHPRTAPSNRATDPAQY